MEFKEIMDYIAEHGEPPEDNLYYTSVDPLFLDSILKNCVLFTTEPHKNYTEMLFRHINTVDWYCLRIMGVNSFAMARFTVEAEGKTKFVIQG